MRAADFHKFQQSGENVCIEFKRVNSNAQHLICPATSSTTASDCRTRRAGTTVRPCART